MIQQALSNENLEKLSEDTTLKAFDKVLQNMTGWKKCSFEEYAIALRFTFCGVAVAVQNVFLGAKAFYDAMSSDPVMHGLLKFQAVESCLAMIGMDIYIYGSSEGHWQLADTVSAHKTHLDVLQGSLGSHLVFGGRKLCVHGLLGRISVKKESFDGREQYGLKRKSCQYSTCHPRLEHSLPKKQGKEHKEQDSFLLITESHLFACSSELCLASHQAESY